MTDRHVANAVPEKPTDIGTDSPLGQADEKRRIARNGRSAAEFAPLSYAQQRLWFLDQLDPGKPFANVSRAFRIRGWLDVEALRRALDTIRERHLVLRSVFRLVDGNLFQVVAAPPTPSLPLVDLGTLPEGERDSKALRLAHEEARTVFDVARGPLLRTTLLRLSAEEHILVVTAHRAVFDERSGDIFDRELAALYETYHEGRPMPLPPLPMQYKDFAIWQREWLRGAALEEQLSYWKRQLTPAPPVLGLPGSRRRPAEPGFRGKTEMVIIGRELAAKIRSLGEREEATLFMSLLVAFQTVLWRHAGRGDITVGSPVDGRTLSGSEGLIGLFANTLVLRADLSGDPTFREALLQAREIVTQAHANHDLPFEKLVEELNPERTLSHPPLFQVMMSLADASGRSLRLAGLSLTPVRLRAEVASYDLALSFADAGEEIRASLHYRTDLFEARTIRRMLAHLEVLLGGIVEDPDRRLSQFPLMAAGERHQVLVEWNQTTVEYPREMTVSRLFEEQAKRTPDTVAVEHEGKSLTYEELNRRANELAGYLRRMGVGPEVLVGLSVRRSFDMVVALFGILKAGGAYVPLDVAYPAERLRYMLKDSGASVALADRAAAAILSGTPARIIVLEDASVAIGAESAESLESGAAPHNLAYVIYTSGSTGRPKGVEVEHHSLANYTQFAGDYFGLRAGDRVLQFASLSFDTAAEEIFATLSRGATLVLRPEEMIATVAGFLEKCRQWNLTVLDLPTAYWHELAAAAFAERLDIPESVRLVVIGGERALPERLEQWRERAGDRVRLLNTYGPSEATIVATCWEPGQGKTESSLRTVPIGRPVANARTYVLDASLQPVPIGIVGELYIGGEGLARGYRNNADLTAERFIRSPFAEADERLYRTGDRARYGPDGELEYMGRADDQLKLRGFRVEPGEVEAALRTHPAVREAAVVLSGGENPRLVAYLVPAEKRAPASADLRSFLKKTLPDFMIPSTFMTIDALPLTPTGKVDRKSLPDPGGDRPELERKYVAPSDIVETKLARLWQKVLGLDLVGTQDDFFELGGHSLLAVRLLYEVEKAFDHRLPLAVIFDAPTVGQLAALLQKEGWSPSWDALVFIQPGGSRLPFYCVHALGGNVLSYKDLARRLGSDLPVYGLQAQGLNGKQPPHRRVEDMAAHYVRAIRQLQPEGPYLLGGLSFGGTVAFEMARQLHAAGQSVPLVVLMDTDNFPHRPPADPPTVARDLGHFFGRLRLHLTELTRLAPGARLPYFREKMTTAISWLRQRLAKRFEAARHPLPEAIRAVNAANQEAADRYVPQPYDGRVILFRSSERKLTPLADPSLGWAAVCRGGLEIIGVEGGHEDIIYEPRVHVLAGELAARLRHLDEAEDGVGCPREAAGSRRSP